MQQGSVVDLTANILILAAKISLKRSMPMADSIILATGCIYQASIWTQDSDFEGIEGVRYVRAKLKG